MSLFVLIIFFVLGPSCVLTQKCDSCATHLEAYRIVWSNNLRDSLSLKQAGSGENKSKACQSIWPCNWQGRRKKSNYGTCWFSYQTVPRYMAKEPVVKGYWLESQLLQCADDNKSRTTIQYAWWRERIFSRSSSIMCERDSTCITNINLKTNKLVNYDRIDKQANLLVVGVSMQPIIANRLINQYNQRIY
jgi:hypothetical protein